MERIIKPDNSQYWKYIRTEPKQVENLPDSRAGTSYTRANNLTRVVDMTSEMVPGAPNIGNCTV